MVSHNPPVDQVHDEESLTSVPHGSSWLQVDAHAQKCVPECGESCVHHDDEDSKALVEAAWLCGERAIFQTKWSAD